MEVVRLTRKRKSSKEEIKSNDEKDDSNYSSDEKEFINRKSLRLSKIKSPSARTRSSLEECKLNGAQFIAAASVGNLSPLSSIVQLDSNGQVDLNKLLQHIELLNKTLNQHSILFKKLNNSIEKLSDKLDFTIKSISENKLNNIKSLLSKNNNNNYRIFEFDDENENINEEKSNECLKSQNNTSQTHANNINQIKNSNIVEDSKSDVLLTNHIDQQDLLKNLDDNNNNNNIDNNNYKTVVSTDSSESDDDEKCDESYSSDDETNSDDRRNRKKKSSNGSYKGSNFAILNKTKIDTEFISGLIPNKDPNDKRYDSNEINKLRLLSHSYQNFAVKLLVRLFDEEEILGRNVYGRNYSGDKSIMKQPLDPERINFIKETVIRLTKTNNPELAWASCVIAMNRKLVDINNKYIKNNKLKN